MMRQCRRAPNPACRLAGNAFVKGTKPAGAPRPTKSGSAEKALVTWQWLPGRELDHATLR